MSLSTLTSLLIDDASEVVKGAKYLVTDDDGNGRLPYTDEAGNLDHGRMGGAWAALHDGYRGNKYEGPDKQKAIAKLKALYASANMETPNVQKGGPGSGPQFGVGGVIRSSDDAEKATAQARASKTPQAHRDAARAHVTAAKVNMAAASVNFARGKVMEAQRQSAAAAHHENSASFHHGAAAAGTVSKASPVQPRHIESGKYLTGREGESSQQAHSASFTARTASSDAQVRGNGDQAERHTAASKAHLKAATAHDRAAAANSAAGNPAMAEYHQQAGDKHREAADTHAALSGMFTPVNV